MEFKIIEIKKKEILDDAVGDILTLDETGLCAVNWRWPSELQKAGFKLRVAASNPVLFHETFGMGSN